ncbi:putative AAA+ ATPase domain, origin recognition complex, subunit 1, AAA lid [Plasmopara halstedii]
MVCDRTPSAHSLAFNDAIEKLQSACQNLQLSSFPLVMTGREDEREEIYTSLRSSIEQQSAGGPIYISGLPGAGKTSIVKEVIRTLEMQRDNGDLRNFTWVEVNGLQMPRPDVAYSVLWKALKPPISDEHGPHSLRASMGSARLCERLQREFHTKSSTRPMLLVLLDEMDFMLAGKNQVLYNLLEWQTSASAKLMLVGIANTMDLPERLPSKIRSRLGGHRITFPAYTRAQLEAIIQQRLSQLDIFSEEAIQICAKTLAHQSGDVRQALSLCRKAAEVCLHRLTDSNEIKEPNCGREMLVTGEDLFKAQQAVSVSAPMSRLRACSKFECTLLVALRMEVRSFVARGVNKNGVELEAVIERFAILCKTHSFFPIPRLRGLLFICDELEHSGVIKQIYSRTSRYPLLEMLCSHQELQDVFLTHPIGMQLIS